MTLDEIRKAGVTSKPVPCRPVLEIKRLPDGGISKWKSRFVVQGHAGYLHKFEHYWETFSAAPNIATTRILQLLVVQGWHSRACDIETAFLWGKLPVHERMPVIIPHEKGTYRILKGNLYGLPQADRVYTETRNKFILEEFNKGQFECRRNDYDPCLFMFTRTQGKNVSRMFCVIHTDDVDCVAEKLDDITTFFAALHDRFRVKAGDPSFMLGLQRNLSDDGKVMTIKMTGFINDLYDQYEPKMLRKVIPKAPFPPSLFLSKVTPETADPLTAKRIIGMGYQRVVGSLLWAQRNCYPECSVGVQYLCRQMSSPTEVAWKAALHMVAYLKGRNEYGIRYTRSANPTLSVYYDASNKADMSNGCSIGGHVAMLLGGPIEWCSKKLPEDSPGQSAHHNEYMALAAASKTTQWLRLLLEEMGLGSWVSGPTRIYGDNDAATQLAREDILTIANRYYAKESHFSKKAFQHGITNPVRVPGTENLADGLTKALPIAANDKLNPMLKGYVPITPESAPSGLPHKIQRKSTTDRLDTHIPNDGVREKLRSLARANEYKDTDHGKNKFRPDQEGESTALGSNATQTINRAVGSLRTSNVRRRENGSPARYHPPIEKDDFTPEGAPSQKPPKMAVKGHSHDDLDLGTRRGRKVEASRGSTFRNDTKTKAKENDSRTKSRRFRPLANTSVGDEGSGRP